MPLSTVRRMENGDIRTFLFKSLRVPYTNLAEIDALENHTDTTHDDIGLTLMDEQLPKRAIRTKGIEPSGAL